MCLVSREWPPRSCAYRKKLWCRIRPNRGKQAKKWIKGAKKENREEGNGRARKRAYGPCTGY